ncbi:Bax inhibitor-1/YccA family protein [Enterococcus hirae]|nr:Bax inhibitor-1/YccA family protein [Enterococcus hirae]
MNNATAAQAGSLNRFFGKVYGLMGVALALSGLVAYLAAVPFQAATLSFLGRFPFAFLLVWIFELGLVVSLSRRSLEQRKGAAAMFVGFAVLNGFTLSITLMQYSIGSIAGAFFVTSATFVVMAIIGTFTKRDLSGIGHAAISALIGVIIAMLLNTFLLHSSPVDLLLMILMVVIFSGLIAYDHQRIKVLYQKGAAHNGVAIFMALELYLDFINLFLAFIRIFGRNN